jgi:hypothetical protein
MNDFDYDVKEKKRIARGAYAKKNGSRSKKCTMPDDYLTPAQRKKLNGPTVTYKLGEPMAWAQFTGMPRDLQRKFIEKLRDEYKATSAMISHEMFGMAESTLSRYTNMKAPELKGMFPKARRPKPTKAEREKWLEFIGKPDLDDDKAIKPYRIEEPEPETVPHPTDDGKFFMKYAPGALGSGESVAETPAPVCEDDLMSRIIRECEETKRQRLTRISVDYEGAFNFDDVCAMIAECMEGKTCTSFSFTATFN